MGEVTCPEGAASFQVRVRGAKDPSATFQVPCGNGVLQPLERMSSPMRRSSNIRPSRRAFKSMLLMESDKRPSYAPPELSGVDPSGGRDVAEQFVATEQDADQGVSGSG